MGFVFNPFMRKEPRIGKVGRFIAAEYDAKMNAIKEDERGEYVARFVNELMDYSFQRVKED